MKEHSKEWLKKAKNDFTTAKANLKIKRYDAAAFFCQQAIENGLKAIQVEKTDNFDKTHDLAFLGEKVGLAGGLLKICEEITEFYVQTRYPDSYVKFNRKKVSDALVKAEKVMEWIKKSL